MGEIGENLTGCTALSEDHRSHSSGCSKRHAQFQCLGDLVSVEAHRNLDERYEKLGRKRDALRHMSTLHRLSPASLS